MTASRITVDGVVHTVETGERLIDALNRLGIELPQVCYHPQLGPIQTCDTCIVLIDGKLERACAAVIAPGMTVSIASAADARQHAFDRILSNHVLYCTVCDNNNGNCTVHNTQQLLAIEHQKIPFSPSLTKQDHTNPFYRYDPQQCILCGRCVEACQNVQVNETLSISWEDPHPRVLWDGGRRSENPVASPAAIALPCALQCPHGKIHARPRGISYRPAEEQR